MGVQKVGYQTSGVKVALLVLGLALALLSACSSPAAPAATAVPAPGGTAAQPAVKGDAAAGKQLYDTNCAGCHGANAAGGQKIGDATAADIRGPALEKTFSGNHVAIQQAILNGKGPEGEELNQAMPRWQGKLAQEQVDNIIAYLYTLK